MQHYSIPIPIRLDRHFNYIFIGLKRLNLTQYRGNMSADMQGSRGFRHGILHK